MPPFASLFPPNTVIKDFAYSSSHPLRLGNFEVYETEDDGDYSYDDDQSPDQSPDEINRRAVALFDFTPENDNEVKLVEGQVIWISYRHGQGWLVAEDPVTGENGLVPEEYMEVIDDDEEADESGGISAGISGGHPGKDPVASGFSAHSSGIADDTPKPFLPGILRHNQESDSDWVDTEYEDDEEETPHALAQQLHNVKLDEHR